jgi:hypothetical protein
MYGDTAADIQRLQASLHSLNQAIAAATRALAAAKATGDDAGILRNTQALAGLRAQVQTTKAEVDRLVAVQREAEMPGGIATTIAGIGTTVTEALKKLGTAGAMALVAVLILTFARRR